MILISVVLLSSQTTSPTGKPTTFTTTSRNPSPSGAGVARTSRSSGVVC